MSQASVDPGLIAAATPQAAGAAPRVDALRHAFPAHTVRAALLWTDGCRIMEIPAALLDRAVPGLWERAPGSP